MARRCWAWAEARLQSGAERKTQKADIQNESRRVRAAKRKPHRPLCLFERARVFTPRPLTIPVSRVSVCTHGARSSPAHMVMVVLSDILSILNSQQHVHVACILRAH
jgi:hypothetical protein